MAEAGSVLGHKPGCHRLLPCTAAQPGAVLSNLYLPPVPPLPCSSTASFDDVVAAHMARRAKPRPATTSTAAAAAAPPAAAAEPRWLYKGL